MTDPAMEKLVEEARKVVEAGGNVHHALRNLTLAAFHRTRLQAQEQQKIVQSVIRGAVQGLGKTGEKSRQVLSEALAGVDEALASTAEASKLAIEEAAGRLHEFGKQDLERAFNDMRTLEQMYLDTLQQVADRSASEARIILQDLWQHAKNTGTAAGAAAGASLASLEQRLGRKLHEVAATGTDAALGSASKLAEAAATILGGIAERLEGKAKVLKQGKQS